ncbi:DUF1993 domain-containing protein [Patescibacteria group bacterium]|nr:DUF1993 domain-containing protein [Patescibacteria group bacterium]
MNPLYQFTLPLFVKQLTALDGILVKAQNFVKEQGLSEADLLEKRLAPDMFPLKKQIQIACDNAKGAAGRLSGTEIPVHADDESSFEELRARIQKTLAFVATISEGSCADANERHVVLPYVPGKYLNGFDYAREYAIPNFFFHVVTAYGILRQAGLAIGKTDYMGALPFKDGS